MGETEHLRNSGSNDGATPDLAQLAAVARRALAADAVLVAIRSRGRPPAWAGVSGVSVDDLPAIGTALTEIGGDLQDAPIVSAASLARLDAPPGRVLLGHGFHSMLCAAVHVDGEHAGEIFALRRAEGAFDDEELILVFARHAAVTGAHRRLRRHTATLAERLEDHEALDQLALFASDFADLSRKLSLHVAPLFGAALTGIMVWDEQRQVLQMVEGSFGATDELVASYQISGSDAHSNAARVFATGRPYLSNDARGDPGILQDYVAAFGIQRTLSLPLRVGGQTIGVLHIANKGTDFTVEDLHRAEVLAPRIATVVELARTVFLLRRQQSIEGILARLAVSIASGESIQDFLRPALRALCAATEANVIGLLIGDSQPIVARRGARDADREAVTLGEARGKTESASCVSPPRQPGDPGAAALHFPVWLRSQRIGSIAALRLRGEPFTADERQALERLGHLAALAYASERYQQQRAKLARIEERDRIADDLHDDVAQILFAAQLALDASLECENLPAELAEPVLRARRLLVKGDSAIRSMIHQLSRPATPDLADRLRGVVATVEEAYGLPIHLEITNAAATAAREVPQPVADALVKAAREALVNAAKHAGPCRAIVMLDLDANQWLQLAVVDDGLGLGQSREGDRHGLASMRRSMERQGGTLSVRSGSAGGSKVTVTMPV